MAAAAVFCLVAGAAPAAEDPSAALPAAAPRYAVSSDPTAAAPARPDSLPAKALGSAPPSPAAATADLPGQTTETPLQDSATPGAADAAPEATADTTPEAPADSETAEFRIDPDIEIVVATATEATPHPRPRPSLASRTGVRCTADGSHCISQANYIPDVCRTIEETATEAGLDVHFFARLLWKESLYDPAAISPVGAQGIAQFMPYTAQLRGLDDPFNPAKALRASAHYLAELRDFYGNLGLAAAAYNAGEARVDDFVRSRRSLPPETRDYVRSITGFSGEAWRDEPPKGIDLRLDKARPFQDACVTLAGTRSIREYHSPVRLGAWGVIVAANPSRAGVEQKYAALSRAHPVLRGQKVSYVRMTLPARSSRQYIAQIGAGTRKAADGICWKLRKSGVGCFVLRN
ncbi:transglycosylase SLT domain-containing protein [Tropicimonas sp. IMCC34043]|uniref:transglycosylase SLT domain-containing protein n=1 Tax=Tropicimonas sp. IMCC34043 TaxID=2248760 RepID=UPI0013001DF3|nr:lytic transglycosylase domain-containing protein [Tropicimonas sp. IMCC34043]